MIVLLCSSVLCVPSKHSKSFKFDFRMSCFNCNIFHSHYIFRNVEQCFIFGFYAILSQWWSSAMMTGFLTAVFRKIACTQFHWTKAGEWPFVCTLHFSVPRRKMDWGGEAFAISWRWNSGVGFCISLYEKQGVNNSTQAFQWWSWLWECVLVVLGNQKFTVNKLLIFSTFELQM